MVIVLTVFQLYHSISFIDGWS